MFIVLIRTAILYILVFITMRIMGKREIGQLEPFDFTLTIMISNLATIPMEDTRMPLLNGIIPIITLLTLEILFSLVQLKSQKIRSVLTGNPSILIKNGKINIKELDSQKFDINDLFEEIRLKGYLNISDIQYAILETNGQLSIIPKSELKPPTKKDLNLPSSTEFLPVCLIVKGKINYKGLKQIKKDTKWLYDLLKEHKINSEEDVFLAILDSNQEFSYQPKE